MTFFCYIINFAQTQGSRPMSYLFNNFIVFRFIIEYSSLRDFGP